MNVELHLAFRQKDQPCSQLIERYCERINGMRRINVIESSNNAKLTAKTKGGRVWRVLCASDGELLSSEAFAEAWHAQESAGTATAQILIGGPDGWVGDAKPARRWAFGRITLPHALAAVVATEQIYRALTYLAGHPYHHGHA